jgi:hypothetical protein
MNHIEKLNNKKSGVWIMRVENSCKLCAFEHIDDVHTFAYESGASLDKIIKYCEDKYDFIVSKSTLSRHFNNHFIKAENKLVDVSSISLSPNFSKNLSLNALLEQIEKREANFFDSVSHLVKSKLVQYKIYDDLSCQIKDELDKTTLSDSGEEISGIIMTDRHTSDLFKRFVYLEKEKNIINSEIADMIFKAQNVIVKTDQEYVKNFVQMTKKFLIQSLVNQLANLLIDLKESGIIDNQQRSAIAVAIVNLMERFEVEMKIDILFQKSLELLRDEEIKSNGGE